MSNETQDFAAATDVEQRPHPAADPATETAPEAPDAPRSRRWDVVRDACAAVLLVLALVVPWNVSFGLGLPNHTWWLYAVVTGATMLALVALAASHGGPLSKSEAIDKVRLGLTAPYLVVLVGFVGFAIYDFVVISGGGATPPGIGPGVLVGAAGAFLAAQPVLAGGDDHRRFVGWFVLASRIATWAKFFVTVSVLLTLYLRTRDVLPNVFDSSIAWPSIATVLTTVAYGAVAVIAVWIGLRWMQQEEMDAGLATIALGAATVVGALLVWLLPFGRAVDAFHGIAQATSTAGVGYEGYLVWAAGAAIFAPPILWQAATRPVQASVWHDAMRKCLLLIAVWCVGSAVLRIFDVIVETASGVPLSLTDSAMLFVFDLAAAGLAYWLRANVAAASEHPAAVSRLSGVLVVLLLCRVVLGVGLARPIQYAAQPDSDGSVYGNTLARQLTSTFDVVLCLLALAVLAVAVFVLGRQGSRDDTGSNSVEAVTAAEAVPAAQALTSARPVTAPPAPKAAVVTRPPVPKWQAPSQWAAPVPHEAVAPEPEPEAARVEPVELEPVELEPVELEPVQLEPTPAEEPEEAPYPDVTPDPQSEIWTEPHIELSMPEAQHEEDDESSSAETTSANAGRHRHRLRPASTDAE